MSVEKKPGKRGRPPKTKGSPPDPRTVKLRGRDEQIVAAFAAGKQPAEIAAEFGVSRQRVWQIVERHDPSARAMMASVLVQLGVDEAREKLGLTHDQMARALGFSGSNHSAYAKLVREQREKLSGPVQRLVGFLLRDKEPWRALAEEMGGATPFEQAALLRLEDFAKRLAAIEERLDSPQVLKRARLGIIAKQRAMAEGQPGEMVRVVVAEPEETTQALDTRTWRDVEPPPEKPRKKAKKGHVHG